MIVTELEALVILSSIPYLGAIKIRILIKHFGSARDALKASIAQLEKFTGFEKVLPHWNRWNSDKAWQSELRLVEKYGVKLISFTDPQYPKHLLEIADYPALLYVNGDIKPLDQRSIAIVGTRGASIYGSESAASIAAELASTGFTVVSGLARGIDTAAHSGALKYGRTIAVIGSGLANIYPAENIPLANLIAKQGALISEFPMATAPDRPNFPQRNRIVSGMSMATLLIEAPVKSGAMITMEKAFVQKRKLFALPGRADQEQFRGNHLLIKQGKAQLVENARDIIVHFQDLFSLSVSSVRQNFIQLSTEEQTFLKAMPSEELNIDALCPLVSLPVQHVQRILMSLILKRAVKEFPGKIYKKTH